MSTKIKRLVIFIIVSCMTTGSYAKNKAKQDNELAEAYNDYDANYYENEGSLTFKARINAIKSNAKQKGLPPATNSPQTTIGAFAANGFGADASTTIFLSNHIAAELSVGFNIIRTKNANLLNIANNYNSNNITLGKRKDLYMIPMTITGQYHVAPYGGIRPYVGGGYHAAYMFTKSKSFKLNNAYGPVIQVGIDFYAKDDTLITIDVRQYFLKSKATYKSGLVGGSPITSKVTFNPLILSLGIGFRF